MYMHDLSKTGIIKYAYEHLVQATVQLRYSKMWFWVTVQILYKFYSWVHCHGQIKQSIETLWGYAVNWSHKYLPQFSASLWKLDIMVLQQKGGEIAWN